MNPSANATGRQARPRHAWGLILAMCLMVVGMACLAGHALAQPGEDDWAVPVNLSRGGAASSPAIVPQPNGALRVLWWDQLEGLMVADGPVPAGPAPETAAAETPQPEPAGGVWTAPQAAPILMPVSVLQAGQYIVVPTPVQVMPLIVGDTGGRAQAFWLGEPHEETGERPLHYSRMAPDRVSWTRPLTMAIPAGAFDATADLSGTLHLAYVQPTQVGNSPGGLYYRRSGDGGASWSAPTAVYHSRYLRLLPAEGGAFRLTAGDANNLAVTWQDPRQGEVLLSQSTDGGATWQEPRPLLASDAAPLRNEVIAMPGQSRRFLRPVAGAEGGRLAVSSSGDGLVLALWDGERWAATGHLNLDFQDPELGPALSLRDLRLAFVPFAPGQDGAVGALVVAGSDPQGDLWVTAIGVDALAGRLTLPESASAVVGATAQGGPVNLSRSGAASDPAIVAGPGGKLHAFWMDRFDGLMVADGAVLAGSVPSGTGDLVTLLDSWSEPRPVPLPATSPWIVSDAGGRVHALWLHVTQPQATGEEPSRQLLYSRLAADGAAWSSPVILAESILVLDVTADTTGGLHLAYLLSQQTDLSPAGVYYRRTGEDGSAWTAPVPVYTSRYLRLLTPESAHLRLAAGGASRIYITWDDPRLGHSLLAHSADGGVTWQPPVAVGSSEIPSARCRLVAPPRDDVLVLWEPAQSRGGTCTLLQAPARAVLDGSAGDGQQVLPGLFSCPGNERFLPIEAGQILMVAGAGSDALVLALWDGARWSEPRRWSQSFEDAEMSRRVYLGDLQAALVRGDRSGAPDAAGGALAAVGVDSSGDVWATSSRMGDLEMIFAPPSPWSALASFAPGQSYAGVPATAVDAEGWLHVLWSEAESAEEPGQALFYARWDGTQWTDATGVLSSADGKADEPALVAVGDRLHAVWSGGQSGPLLYSSTFARDAFAATGWREPLPLPVPGVIASAPDIAVDVDGTLHVVYAVPVNEGRGIYYTRSADGGETWLPERQVLDAAAAGWLMADHPQVAVDAQGLLHVVMARNRLPGRGLPEGVYYAGSFDGGETWSEPFELAEGVHAWPQVATTGPGQVHVAWNENDGQPAWWHRWSPDAGRTWGRAERVAGFENVSAPAVLVDNAGGALYLLGLGSDAGAGGELLLSTWDGQRWSAPEAMPVEVDGVQPGVAASVQAGTDWLHVILRAENGSGGDEARRQLLQTGRQLPAAAVTTLPSVAPLATATANPTPEPTVTPRPTAGFGLAPPDTAEGSVPLAVLLPGVLAALMVAGALAWRFLLAARR